MGNPPDNSDTPITERIRQAALAFKPGNSPHPRFQITLSEEARDPALTDAQITRAEAAGMIGARLAAGR